MKALFRSLAMATFVVTIAWALETTPGTKPAPVESGGSGQKSSAPAVVVPGRGELLYENHCTGCHESKLHVRERRRAKSVVEIEGWVRRWSGASNLGWSGDDIQAVTRFLARRYYKFEVPSERN
jgi:cytochrome c5